MKTAPALAGRTGQGAPWWHWWAWLPVLAVAATIAVLSFARIPATAEPELAAWLYNIVVVGAAFLGSLLAGRAYLAGGGRLAAALGASMLIFGVGCVVGMTLAHQGLRDSAVAIHNLGALLSATACLLGAVWILGPGRGDLVSRRSRALRLTVAYIASVMTMGLIASLAVADRLPPFWTPAGPTALRQAVLTVTITAFAAAALWFAILGRRSGSPALLWYWLGLVLIAIGLAGVARGPLGSPLSWAGRCAQAIGLVYCVVGLRLMAGRSSGAGLARALVNLQRALGESEQRYQMLFNTMTEGFALHEIITDDAGRPIDYRFLSINAAFERLTGLQRTAVIGRRVREMLPGIEDHWIQAYGRVALTGESTHFENHAALLDRWYDVYAYRVGERQFAVIFTDITQRKATERSLRQSREDLDRAQEVAQIGSWRLDTKRNILTWSDENHRIFGVPKGTPLTYEAFLATVHPDDRERVDARWSAAVRGEPYDIEHRIVSGGAVKWVREKAYLEWDDDGNLLGGFGITQDITERKQAEDAMRSAKTALEAANAAKDRFIAALSHELRTPLTPALAAIGVMKDDPRLPEELRQDAAMVHRNLNLEVQLVADLLDVTRIATGKLHLHRHPTDVAAVIREAARICAGDLDAKEQTLTIELPDQPCLADADAARLHQVFWNLIRNAVKFTPHGGRIEIVAQVAAAAAAEPRTLRASVRDNGLGISPRSLEHIFRPFEQDRDGSGAARDTQFGGLGLGLAICKAVVEAHGGRISANSPGIEKGATFTVDLPLAVASEPASRSPVSVTVTARNVDCAQRCRILLVEDHADTAKVMARLLRLDGHEVQVANSVAEALRVADRQDFDVLVSDLGLPDRSGDELMRELLAAGRPIRGIALSGYGTQADIDRSHQAGFAEHITKPVDFAILRAAIHRVATPRPVPVAPVS